MTKENFAQRCRRSVIGAENQVPLLGGGYITGANFDNAATTPPFCAVMRQLRAFAPWYSSVHRGTGYKSMVSSDMYDAGRKCLKAFVGADDAESVLIYTKNTTESINLLAETFYQMYPEAVILSTQMEHLANDLPWRTRFCVDYVRTDSAGRLDMNDLESRLAGYRGRVKLVTMTGASNVTGFVNPVHRAAEAAHRYGAEILVDGAQLVPHRPFAMCGSSRADGIDYLVFSAHKMYAPFGVGVLIGPARTFRHGAPFVQGGGAIRLVTGDSVEWDDPPYRQEAGTPNVIGAAALLWAAECLRELDMDRIHAREQAILAHIDAQLRRIPGIRLYGSAERDEEKVSILSFSLPQLPHRLVAQILSYEYGIAVRSGLFCAHPYVQRLLGMTPEQIAHYKAHPELPFPGLVRVSLGLYQEVAEADRLICGIRTIAANQREYREKYEKLLAAQQAGKHPFFHPLERQLP